MISKHDYFLGFESKLKEDFNKLCKNHIWNEIPWQNVHQTLFLKYSTFYSPLKWFELYANEFLIIV